MSTILKYIIGALVIVAIVLGYKIYDTKFGSSETEGASVSNETPRQSTQPTGGQASESTDREALLDSPGQNATESQRQAYADFVSKAAVKTNTIDINSCTPTPIVATFKNKSDVTLVNNDTGPHTIVFDAKTFFTVPAKSTKIIKAEFGYGTGIYGYGCDTSNGAVGMVVVTE